MVAEIRTQQVANNNSSSIRESNVRRLRNLTYNFRRSLSVRRMRFAVWAVCISCSSRE
mgnify:CR=1 FL=1